ncbi:hypothetical protein EMIHUDRAFT_197258 [Emiliania huxleyi CCMP1516]|uniref:Dynein heavy chain coiled coil stalk domain-containing protein n=2 Tax=Emiliania huxleyi TaxID=2903 RepID=A0A0D3ITZ7_EMIH1|nr:hypothetical protein EMIHUDRAFT_197258 [Emiliania huxleyi CCMP1516]EOD14732.1 hypothetical protein EMIHUDRAFT_197258 [Emiliania huxleyi CCMP1516]|eukprot:XP_005767161.1 hypothetical protein EMIHUDRAFT_197258 [Emiliania huxleyi CCMP1516]
MVGKWHAMHALTPRSSRLQASEAREGVAKRDGMLSFVSKEVESVKSLFAQKEGEMRVLLKANEAQRRKAARDVSQLARICDEWRTAAELAP